MNEIKINPVQETKRYFDNAKKILSENTTIKDGFYSDSKYVKIASNTVYNGILIALDAFAEKKGKKPKNRSDKKFYENLLAQENRKMLTIYNSLYNYLHLFGGYDGDRNVTTFKTGYKLANDLLKWLTIKLK